MEYSNYFTKANTLYKRMAIDYLKPSLIIAKIGKLLVHHR